MMTADVENIVTPVLRSLATEGPGFFETHVTWDDIQINMQNSLGTKASFGENKKVANIGDGNGFLSRICLIEADWRNVEEGEELPEKFIVKICTLRTMLGFSKNAMIEQKDNAGVYEQWIEMIKEMELEVKEFHNSEVNVYKLFEKYGLQEKIKMCKVYHLQKFTEEEPLKGHIIMEFKDDLQSVKVYDKLPVEALCQPLRSLAAMQAASLRFTNEERSWFKTRPFTELFGKFFRDDKVEMFTSMLRSFGEGKLDANVDLLLTNIKSILDPIKYDEIPAKLGMRSVLCHGDMWATNILWKKTDDQYKMVAVIDYQTSHFGSPSIDLVRLLSTALSGKDRREHSWALLEKYYEFLLEELNGDEAPFTIEQLKEAFEIFFPLGAYMVLPMVGPMVNLILKNPDEEYNHKVQKLAFDKTECLLQDILNYLERQK